MDEVNRRKYQSVSANTTVTDEYTPADGESVRISMMGANAAHNSEVKVEISFGTECLLSTHGDVPAHDPNIMLEGDGSKILKIKLVNDSSSTETIGGFYKAAIS